MQLIHWQCKWRSCRTPSQPLQLGCLLSVVGRQPVEVAMWFANTHNFCHRANCDKVWRDVAPHYRVPHQSTIAYGNRRHKTGLRTTRNTACSTAQRFVKWRHWILVHVNLWPKYVCISCDNSRINVWKIAFLALTYY